MMLGLYRALAWATCLAALALYGGILLAACAGALPR